MAEPNNAAMYSARNRHQRSGSQVLETIVSTSNCELHDEQGMELGLFLKEIRETCLADARGSLFQLIMMRWIESESGSSSSIE